MSSFRHFLSAPTFPTAKETRSAHWLNLYLLGAIVFGATMSLLSLITPADADSLGSGSILSIGTVWQIFALLALRRHRLQTAIFMVFLILFGMVTYSMVIFDGIRATSVIGYFLLLALVNLLATPRITVISTAVCLVAVFIIYYLEQIGMINASFAPRAVPFNLVLLTITLILNSLMLWLNVRQMTESIVEAEHSAKQLATEASKMQAILAGIADGVLVFDTEGKILLLNPAGEQLLGQSAEELVGKSMTEFAQTGIAGDKVEQLAQQFTVSDHQSSTGWKLLWKDRILSLSTAPVQGDLGTAVVFRDVTAEEEISRMKTDFISIASHELRTPLTSVKGFITILLNGVGGPMSGEQTRLLNIAKDNADRLHRLVNDLLDLSRIESGRMKLERSQLLILPVIQSVGQELSGLFTDKGLTLDLELPAFLPLVWADETHIRQILSNLLSNAVKYTKEGGATIRTDITNGYLYIHIQDSGLGISKADQAKLFGRFFRSDAEDVRMEQGTGLGLNITQALVLLQGGEMKVDSTLDEGSTFTFTLPLVETKG